MQFTYQCRTCQKDSLTERTARNHKTKGHDVLRLNTETGVLEPAFDPNFPKNPKAPKGGRPKKVTPIPINPQATVEVGKALALDSEGGGYLLQHYSGFKREEEEQVFVIFSNGRVRDFRLQFSDAFPYYQLFKNKLGYGGTFPEFLYDAVESLVKLSGFELALVPRAQNDVYNEVGRLLSEGQLAVSWDSGELKLEVINARVARRADGGDGGDGETPDGSACAWRQGRGATARADEADAASEGDGDRHLPVESLPRQEVDSKGDTDGGREATQEEPPTDER